jgi:WD40 repeat protein
MSVSPAECPVSEVLEGVAAGQPAPASLRAHLATCESCRRTIERIRDDNRFLSGFAVCGALPAARRIATLHDIEVPGYEIIREIHRGGQGVVYEAVQHSTHRDVAVKVMRQGPFATLSDRARFEREIETLGKLEHPNIVTVHDAGVAAGFHYFVMNYVDGLPLDEWVAQLDATATEAKQRTVRILDVFISVCEAVHAAHLRGVIHRDLKPSNIRVDRTGRPHVLDFGLAKSADSQHETAMTRTGQFVGSLPWASPEQVEAASAKIDLRTDVYSLGAILFQLLTGTLPFDVGSNLRDVLDDILRREPRRPSSISGSQNRPRIDGELDTIVLKCLAKDRDRRYQSAGELARDLRCHLAGEPIEARRDSAMYVLRKTLRRYRLRVAAAGAFVVLLAVFGVVMAYLYRRSAGLERDATRTAATLAELLSASNIEQGRMAGMLGNLPQAEQLLWPELLTARASTTDPARTLNAPPGPLDAYWALWELYRRIPCRRAFAPATAYRGIASAQDGAGIWTVDADGIVRQLSESGEVLDSYSLALPERLRVALISADGATVAVMDGSRFGVYRRSVGTKPVIDLPAAFDTVRLSRSGARIVLLNDGGASVWGVDPPKEIARFSGLDLTAAAISDDDRQLAARDRKGGLHIGVIETGSELLHIPPPSPSRSSAPQLGELLFSPDGQRLADAWWERPGRIWDLHTSPPLAVDLAERPGGYRVQAFSADGRRLAVADVEGFVRVFDAQTGQRTVGIAAHRGRAYGIAFSSDGERIWTQGESELRLWEVDPSSGMRISRVSGEMFHAVDASTDGRWLFAGGAAGALRRIDRGSIARDAICTAPGQTITCVAIGPDARRVAVATYANSVEIREVGQIEQTVQTLPHPNLVSHVCFSADGTRIATACEDRIVRVWRSVDGMLDAQMPVCSNRVPQVAFSPDGGRLGVAVRDGSLLVWNLATRQTETWSPPTGSALRTLRFTPDGRWLIAGGADRRVKIWDCETRRCVGALAGHTQEIYCIDVHPDGSLIASGDSGGVIRLWQMGLRKPLATIDGHEGAVMSLRFTAAGDALASASLDGTVREWSLTHYGRHIAGQVDAQLTRLAPELRESDAARDWRDWASGVLRRD